MGTGTFGTSEEDYPRWDSLPRCAKCTRPHWPPLTDIALTVPPPVIYLNMQSQMNQLFCCRFSEHPDGEAVAERKEPNEQ